jgi:hypothetical protein
MTIFAGIHYQSPLVYNFFAAVKLGRDYHLRYRLAAQYIKQGESVLDVCAGFGEFRNFLPANCSYQTIEASSSFHQKLAGRGITNSAHNLHQGLNVALPSVDVITMIISLCQFRDTSLDQLLEDFKKIAKRVIIVEDVLPEEEKTPPLVEKVRDYLCATGYYSPMQLFSVKGFQAAMAGHGYQCRRYNDRYWIGHYEHPVR